MTVPVSRSALARFRVRLNHAEDQGTAYWASGRRRPSVWRDNEMPRRRGDAPGPAQEV